MEGDSLEVATLQSAGHVHMSVQEAVQDSAFFGLFDLQLSQQVNEPLETPLLTVDPEKVHLLAKVLLVVMGL